MHDFDSRSAGNAGVAIRVFIHAANRVVLHRARIWLWFIRRFGLGVFFLRRLCGLIFCCGRRFVSCFFKHPCLRHLFELRQQHWSIRCDKQLADVGVCRAGNACERANKDDA